MLHAQSVKVIDFLVLAEKIFTVLEPPPSDLIAGRPKAALLFWFLGGFRSGVWLCFVILVRYKYRN